MAGLAGKRYAKAVFELSVENNKIDEAVEASEKILEDFSNDEFYKIFTNPDITKEEKQQMINNIYKNHIPDFIEGLLAVILRKNRESDIKEIFKSFLDMAMDYKKTSIAKATSAIPISEEQKNKIITHLQKLTGKKIILETEVRKELLGGLIIEVDGKVFDRSFRTRIKEIRENLLISV